MMVTILGKRWRFRFTPFKAPKGKPPHHGECDHPEKKRKEIRINSELRNRERLEAILHELFHATEWEMLSELWVEQAAFDISKILWKLNYKSPDDDD